MKFLFTLLSVLLAPLAAFASDLPPEQFLTQVLDAIRGFGGMPWTLKIATVCLLLVGSMKVSFARPLWDRLGAAKPILAPLLAMVGGVLSQGATDLPTVTAYLFAGAGAIVLHELLDALKAAPFLGAPYRAVIEFVAGVLGKPKSA